MKGFFNNSLILSFCFLSFLLKAQFNQQDLQPFGGADAAVSALLGPGVQFSNAEFIGSKDQIGTFNNGLSQVGIEQGIIIATSNLTYPTLTRSDLNGTDNPNSHPSGGLNDVNDPFISGSINDYASLSFEFIATSDLLKFEFVFASAEYPFFVFSNFNDKFVFVLTELNQFGGIVNESNIALLPGSNTVISINTVNNGSTNPQFSSTPAVNPEYFVASNNNWIYPGRTTLIPISKEIRCGTRYKLRISICDIGDKLLDSAVFLKSASWNNEYQVGEIQVPTGPYCEGDIAKASVSGPSNALYEWSDGQSGLGLNSIQFITNSNPSEISVNVTPNNIDNCTFNRSTNVLVHSSNNFKPYMNGINNTGIYDVYIRAGEFIEFQVPTFDSPNESVEFFWFPSSIGNQSIENSPLKDIGIFDWTPHYNEAGNYSINAYCVDNNICGNLPSDVYTFNINVICPYCEVGVEYSSRFPNNNPVPPITEAASYIIAGINGPVVVDQPTIFRAGEYIISEVEFVSGGELIQEIFPVCIEEVCDECCHTENIDVPELFSPQIFTPDGDNINDIWYISDLNNPYCAFNATYATLNIFDRFGVKVFTRTVNGSDCCPFKSAPALGYEVLNPLRWDGTCNISGIQTPPVGSIMIHGNYFFEYSLSTCSGLVTGSGDVTIIGSSARYASQVASNVIPEALNNKTNNNFEFLVYPNPSRDLVNISLLNYHSNNYSISIQVHDLSGRLIDQFWLTQNELKFDVSQYISGYYIISLVDIETRIIAVQKLIVR